MSNNKKKICSSNSKKQKEDKPRYHRKEEKKSEEEQKQTSTIIEDKSKQKIDIDERKLIDEERLKAKEELIRLAEEEEFLGKWKTAHETQMTFAYDKILEAEDWFNYSNCIRNYINVRKEKQLHGFLYNLKESSSNNFITNFRLIERNIDDDMLLLNNSQLHYHNLERLLFQAKAQLQPKQLHYSLELMNDIKETAMLKLESITKYFIDNYHQIKSNKLSALRSKSEDQPELWWEYSTNDNDNIKLAFWVNNFVQSHNVYRSVATKFKQIPICINEFHKSFVTKYSIVRLAWYKNDIREYLYNKKAIEAYAPYMSISGCFIIDELVYPAEPLIKGTWEVRELREDRYKPLDGPEDGFTKNVKMRYRLDLKPKIYLKDINDVRVGLYNQSNGQWINQEDVTFKKQEKAVIISTSDLGIYSVLLERKINFPYLNWSLRTIIRNEQVIALLDLKTPRSSFTFEIGVSDPDSKETINRRYPVKAYVKLINNAEVEFEHIANREITFDQMILEFKECGVLLAPWSEDIIECGLKEKNNLTTDRAIEDIVMNCRYYAFRSNEFNQMLSEDVISVKAKPNPNYDRKFIDDEDKDWNDIAWYPNKATIGKFVLGDNGAVYFKSSIEMARPHLHLIIKDTMPEEVYFQVSEDDFSSAFLVNLRNFIRLLGIVHMP